MCNVSKKSVHAWDWLFLEFVSTISSFHFWKCSLHQSIELLANARVPLEPITTCTSTSWCAWTPRGKKEGKRICVQQPPDLAVSRNSSAINDNRFKYQFSACIELRGECTPRGYGIPSIFRSSSFWGGIYQRCQASGQKGFVDKKDARAKLEIRCFWLRCGRKSIGWMMDLIGFDIWNFSTNLESVHLERRCWRFFLLDRTIRGEVVKNFPLRFLWNSLFYQEKESTLQRRRFQVLSLSSYFILVSIFLFVPKIISHFLYFASRNYLR